MKGYYRCFLLVLACTAVVACSWTKDSGSEQTSAARSTPSAPATQFAVQKVNLDRALFAYNSYIASVSTPEDANKNLLDLMSRWTDSRRIQDGKTTIDYSLTYISPQLLAAAVVSAAMAQGIPRGLMDQVLRNSMTSFFERNELPFMLFVRTNDNSKKIKMGQLSDSVCLVSLYGIEAYPSGYDRSFDSDAARGLEGKKGFLFFPSVVDIERHASFSVHLKKCSHVAEKGKGVDHEITWNFRLVSIEFPIEAILKTLPPYDGQSNGPDSDKPLLSTSDKVTIAAAVIQLATTILIR